MLAQDLMVDIGIGGKTRKEGNLKVKLKRRRKSQTNLLPVGGTIKL
jgi:hypothetical protein